MKLSSRKMMSVLTLHLNISSKINHSCVTGEIEEFNELTTTTLAKCFRVASFESPTINSKRNICCLVNVHVTLPFSR